MGHGASKVGHKIKHFFVHTIGDGAKHAFHKVKHFFKHTVPHGFHEAGHAIKHAFTKDLPHVAEKAGHEIKHVFTKDVPHLAHEAGHALDDLRHKAIIGINKAGHAIDKIPFLGKAITGTVHGINAGLGSAIDGAVHHNWNKFGAGLLGAAGHLAGESMAKQTNKLIDEIPGARTALGFVRIPGTGISLGSLATATRDGYKVLDNVQKDVANGGKFDYKRHLLNAGTGALRFGLSNITPGSIGNFATKGGNMLAGNGSAGIAGSLNKAIQGAASSGAGKQAIAFANSSAGKKLKGAVTGAVQTKAKSSLDNMLRHRDGKRSASAMIDAPHHQSIQPPQKAPRLDHHPVRQHDKGKIAPDGSAHVSAFGTTQHTAKPHSLSQAKAQGQLNNPKHTQALQGAAQHPVQGQPHQGQDDERAQATNPPPRNQVRSIGGARPMPQAPAAPMQAVPTASQYGSYPGQGMQDMLHAYLNPPFKQPPMLKTVGQKHFNSYMSRLPNPNFPGLSTGELIGYWTGNPAR